MTPGLQFLLGQVNSQVVMTAPALAGTSIGFQGALASDDAGTVGVVGVVRVKGLINGQPLDTSFDTDMLVGLDEVTWTLKNTGPLSEFVLCLGTAAGCSVTMLRQCDFDARVSGVYDATLTKTATTGDCSATTPLEGQRQMALLTNTANDLVGFVSVIDEKLAVASSLAFDKTLLSMTSLSFLPTGNEWADGSSASFDLDTSGDNLHLTGSLTQATGSCVQTWQVDASRLRGSKAGVACEAQSITNCTVDFNRCSGLSALGSDASYELLWSPSPEGCPQARCQREVPASRLCTGADRALAAQGCADQQTLTITAQGDSARPCFALGCESDINCHRGGSPANPMCEPFVSTVVFANEGACASVHCESPAECNRDLDCEALGLGMGPKAIDARGCRFSTCRVSDATLAAFSPSVKDALLTRHGFTDLHVNGLGIATTATLTPNTPCSAFDVTASPTQVCPLYGQLDAKNTCQQPSATAVPLAFETLLTSDSGHLCLQRSIRNQPELALRLPDSACASGEVACCVDRVLPGEAPPFACRHPASEGVSVYVKVVQAGDGFVTVRTTNRATDFITAPASGTYLLSTRILPDTDVSFDVSTTLGSCTFYTNDCTNDSAQTTLDDHITETAGQTHQVCVKCS